MRSRRVPFETGLSVVLAVTADLEDVDVCGLFRRQPGSARYFGIDALVIDLLRRSCWGELIVLVRMVEKVGDDRSLKRDMTEPRVMPMRLDSIARGGA